MTSQFIQNIEIKPQKREKLEEELSPNEELEHLWEMATVGRQDACKGLKNGMHWKSSQASIRIQEKRNICIYFRLLTETEQVKKIIMI